MLAVTGDSFVDGSKPSVVDLKAVVVLVEEVHNSGIQVLKDKDHVAGHMTEVYHRVVLVVWDN